MKNFSWCGVLILLLTTTCTSLPVAEKQLARVPSATTGDYYLDRVQPLFNSRCIQCHACVDAPCQLNLTSYDGVVRGTHIETLNLRKKRGDSNRLKEGYGKPASFWREKGFSSVLGDPARGPDAARALLYQAVALGAAHNSAGFRTESLRQPEATKPVCSRTPEELAANSRKFNGLGMPYGLPALTESEVATLGEWFALGAPGPDPRTLEKQARPYSPALVQAWEEFLNAPDARTKLVARYIYEHVFSAHISFKGDPAGEFFELVRSRTAAPSPIDEAITERAFDRVPGPFYYRFRKLQQAVVLKNHIPWEIDLETLERTRQMFFAQPWSAEENDSPNPFVALGSIPAEARYRFMLENARLIVDAMTRGPVCTGQAATYAIRDHFWVFFMDPKRDLTVQLPELARTSWAPLDSLALIQTQVYRSAYNRALRTNKPEGFSAQDLWDGDGTNPNAGLTILRHEASATVHYGHQGGFPGSVWVVDYALFERLYYNLVVEYTAWGSIAHRGSTWHSMNLHRKEGEERFLQFLPVNYRKTVRRQWDEGIGRLGAAFARLNSSDVSTPVDPERPAESLVEQMQIRLPANVRRDALRSGGAFAEVERAFRELQRRDSQARFAAHLPNITFLRVTDPATAESRTYTWIANRWFKFNNIVVGEGWARDPERDNLSVYEGLVGTRPEMFLDLTLEQAREAAHAAQALRGPGDWHKFRDRFGIARNSARVWELNSWFEARMRTEDRLEHGAFDLASYDK